MPLLPRHRLRPRRADTAPAAEALEPRRLLAASLLRDLNTHPVSSSPEALVDFNGALYMTLPGPQGRELYRSDGTPGIATLLKDINPGSGDSQPRDFVVAGDFLYFSAGNGAGRNLWRTDGTPAGTVPITRPTGPDIFVPASLLMTPVGNLLYFNGVDPAVGEALFRTDGTPSGTAMVFDPPGTTGDVALSAMTSADDGSGRVYFATYYNRTDEGARLWITGGSTDTTSLVYTFGRSNIPAWNFTMFQGRLVFTADAGSVTRPTGEELWTSGGTAASTHLVKDILPGADSPGIDGFVKAASNAGGRLFFRVFENTNVGYRLWKTDGTEIGTARVADVSPVRLTAVGGQLYFIKNDFAAPGLWRSDGTASGTVQVAAVAPFGDIVASGFRMYFFADRPAAGLWRSDGTEAGTTLVRALTGSRGALTPFRGGVAFGAQDEAGYNPWASDGTAAGTVRLGPFDDRTLGSWPFGTSPPPSTVAPVQLGDKTLFLANGTGGRAWATDGTDAGTHPLTSATEPFVGLGAATTPDGRAFAYLLSQSGWVYTTDGTEAGTLRGTKVAYRPGGGTGGSVDTLAVLKGNLYFAGSRTGYPYLLTLTDGTDAGTVTLNALDAYNLTASGDAVYFTAKGDGLIGNGTDELWKTDGTPGGTALLKLFDQPGGPVRARNLVDVNGTLFFRATSADYRKEQIWKSDGTPQGTVMVRQFAGITGTTFDPTLVARGQSVYFAASPEDDAGNVELWKSDGSPSGTARVHDVYPGAVGSKPASLARVGDRVYFAATDPDGGRELWVTDGTDGGTTRVADVAPGAADSSPRVVGGAFGRVYFAANDSAHGAELWSSDGTAAGTTLVEDVAPGARGSTPVFATAAGDRLVFWADDGLHGQEPWTAAAPAPPTFVVGRHVFYNNSRFDGRDVGANRADDGAIAVDKQALGFGEIPSVQNVTSYSRGINGLMVDITTRFDFFDEVDLKFKVGTGGDPAGWAPTPTPLSVTHRIDGVPEDVDRVTVVWADGAIRNTWLQVTAEALFGGRVIATDVFYFGNLVGETGAAPALRVDAADFAATRGHVREVAAADSPYDFNRDGRVDVLDLNAVRGNLFKSLGAIAGPPPAAGYVAPAFAPARSAAPKRRSALQEIAGSSATALP